MLTGRVLVTGGAGFLGRGIYRRARREQWPASFSVISRDDAKHAALQARYPEVECVLGDVARMSVEHLADLFRGYDLIIHAAASKYVDRAELAAQETVQVNVVGSINVVQAAIRARVPQVIGISTDKAVLPVNVYGMTKAIMERVFQEAGAAEYPTHFKVCRYGNVIGSTGSVIPMWRKLIAEGKQIKVTDPEMTRYWMSVDQAVEVIDHTVNYASNGQLVIPQPRAMRMGDLVSALLGGDWLPGGIDIVGLRPGEKIHESLLHFAESIREVARSVDPDSWRHYYHLAPPGSPPTRAAEFELVSSQPEAGWIDGAEMLNLIADAETV